MVGILYFVFLFHVSGILFDKSRFIHRSPKDVIVGLINLLGFSNTVV